MSDVFVAQIPFATSIILSLFFSYKGTKLTLTKILESISYLVLELRIENINTYNPSEIVSFLYNKNFIFYKIIKISYTKNGISYMDVIFVKK